MIVDCAHYRDGSRQSDRPISLDEAATQCLQSGFVWLGMFEPSGEELDEVRESFGLHELAVEDAKTFHLRPKVEEYETGVQLVILRTARYNHDQDEVDFGEISIFVGPNFVITVRQGVASELHGARTRLEQHPKLLALGTNSQRPIASAQRAQYRDPDDLEQGEDAWLAEMATGVRPLSRVLRVKRAGPPHHRRRATATGRSQVVDPPARWQPGSRQVDELLDERRAAASLDDAVWM